MSAQPTLSNLRIRYVPITNGIQKLDTLSIAGNTLVLLDSVSGQTVPPAAYKLTGSLLSIDSSAVKSSLPESRTLQARYRVFPFDLNKPTFRIDTNAVQRNAGSDAIEYDFTPYQPRSEPWQTGNVQSNGAYVRGLSLGNNQNLVFNSNLNLQLNGNLGDDLEIQAALSDNSIPLQPDGTTRQLQEFDRIYIQLRKQNARLIAGDFDLQQPPGYFARYFKRLQGASASWQGKINERDSISTQAAAAVSRGKFARQFILGQEGNQGPYRLLGANGEQFIIVLAGTEKVYIDGQLMRRGFEDDYIIDYNLGELTFTARRLITKDIRIIVEFEYTVQAYLRSTVATHNTWATPKHSFYLNLYSEQDSRNAGPAQDLSPEERMLLAAAGDDLSLAFASGVDTISDGFDPSRIFYKSIDTLACGVPTTALTYTTNPDSARFTARFSQVPQGTGNYIQTPTAANGRVYRWVAPDPVTCQPQGNFEPVVQLLAPESRQMFTAGTQLSPVRGGQLQAEAALSGRDLNRYSPIDNEDNYGIALNGFYQQALLNPKRNKGWSAKAEGRYEYAAKNFNALNPYRPQEFIRDWNINTAADRANEHWLRTGASLENKDWGALSYELGSFTRANEYRGTRHLGQFNFAKSGWDAQATINLLQTSTSLEETRFSRPRLQLAKTLFQTQGENRVPMVRIGIYGERERNARTSGAVDDLLATSFWYDLWRVFFETPESTTQWQWNGFVSRRIDHAPVGPDFVVNTRADELKLGGVWRSLPSVKARQSLQWNVHYRTLHIVEQELTPLDAQETYLGRIDYNISAFKQALNATTGYEISSGQSPRIEFNYVQVNPGEGQYTWIDRNQDSILQIDEMEIAVFLDQANYVRVAVTTTDYLRTNNVVFNQNLRFEPRLLWSRSSGWKKVASRLSTQSILQLNRRVLDGFEGVSPWNPFELNIPDSALVNVSSTLRNVLFVNRAQPAWDASISNNAARSQVVLSTGFENRQVNTWNLHGRVNAGPAWSIEADAVNRVQRSDNQAFNSRDFTIRGWQFGPKLSWLPNRYIRSSIQYQWQNSQNQLGNREQARQDQLQASLNWNPPGRKKDSGFSASTAIRLQLTYANVRFDGEANTPVGFAMLEGLQNGRNMLWNIVVDRQLSRSIQLNVSYEGRRTGQARTIHVGRAQVRATF